MENMSLQLDINFYISFLLLEMNINYECNSFLFWIKPFILILMGISINKDMYDLTLIKYLIYSLSLDIRYFITFTFHISIRFAHLKHPSVLSASH